jgi:hypothetical protein
MLELEEIKDAAIATLDNLSLDVEKGAAQYKNIRANQTHLIEQFERHMDYLQKCGNELLSIYRQANTEARSSPCPEHFTKEWVLSRPVEYNNGLNSADPDIDARITATFEGIRSTRTQIASLKEDLAGEPTDPSFRREDHVSGLRSRDRAQKDIKRKKFHHCEVLANHKSTRCRPWQSSPVPLHR